MGPFEPVAPRRRSNPRLLIAAAILSVGLAHASFPPPAADNLRSAIGAMSERYPGRYPRGPEFLRRLDQARAPDALATLTREALLAHPEMQFQHLLLIRRGDRQLGLPQNWQGNSCLPRGGYDNEIAVLSRTGGLQTLFRPEGGRFVGDVDLDFDGKRLLFSMSDPRGPWRIWEKELAGGPARPLQLIGDADVDNYDACHLPDGNLIFSSTAPFTGVPCVTGSSHVANLFRWNRADGGVRRLTFDQDHNWSPRVMMDGRILYQRWEYSDLPHYVSRLLFTMQPDGTNQREFYGSNSYWPNSIFYARPIPGSPTRFAGIVTGHHGVPRMGELVLFDAGVDRHEAKGAIQRIPGRGREVKSVIKDELVDNSWPKFLHPWPLDDRFFLVSAQPAPGARWGIYLVDVFDNAVLLKEEPGYALLDPIPLRPRARPPVLPSQVDPARRDATVLMTDVYEGPGLAGVPRGTVKKLRLFTYHFAYHGMGGQINRVGMDGPWDIKRVLGTVPVEADGSAHFKVPANTPISIQPLDEQGQALQLMRSWATAMPGERLSCVGCHESQNAAPPSPRAVLALQRPASEIAPWHGPARGFSFRREVQPVLDRHCVSCHAEYKDGPDVAAPGKARDYRDGTRFPPSYLALRPFVRGHTMESDMNLLPPGEFHADTTLLVRLLRSGHKEVRLDAESWDRLITWIDLNTPAHGTWTEVVGAGKVTAQRDRRRDLLLRYGGRDEDPEAVPNLSVTLPDQPAPLWAAPPPVTPLPPGPDAAGSPQRMALDAGGVELSLVRVSAPHPYWIGTHEVTNLQYSKFDPSHDSGIEVGDFLQFGVADRGYPVNDPAQPVVRVSWEKAMAYCRWLSAKTGRKATLPTEAQWEFACRAGTATPLWWGEPAADFAPFGNLADARFRQVDNHGWGLPDGAIDPWRPAAVGVHDGFRATAAVGRFKPNPWGLHDMHGNAAEWTLGETPDGRKIARGGSFADRPQEARADSRRHYPPWRRVFDTGFRVVLEDGPPSEHASATP